MCAGWCRKKPLRVSVCFPPSHCELSEPQFHRSSLTDGSPTLQALCLGEGPHRPPLVPWCLGLELLRAQMVDGECYCCSYASTHTPQQSHPLSLLSSSFPAILPTMLRPHFVLPSTYPPSVVACLAPVGTVGLISIHGVSSVCRQMSPVLHSHGKVETDLMT